MTKLAGSVLASLRKRCKYISAEDQFLIDLNEAVESGRLAAHMKNFRPRGSIRGQKTGAK
jgi:hypothetical protein